MLAEDPGFATARALLSRVDAAKGPTGAIPRLKAADDRPVSLQFRDAQTKMVFEVLARQTGLNFVFDKDVKSDSKTTIFVNQVPVENAIDLILTQNQLGWQVLSENLVLVYPNTAAKQKDYREEIVHTFYLTNATPKDAESLLKTVLGTKTLFVDEKLEHDGDARHARARAHGREARGLARRGGAGGDHGGRGPRDRAQPRRAARHQLPAAASPSRPPSRPKAPPPASRAWRCPTSPSRAPTPSPSPRSASASTSRRRSASATCWRARGSGRATRRRRRSWSATACPS